MQVRLLGPVDVMAPDGPRPVRGLRRKTVLATLALHGGEIVSTGQLLDVVWGATAPSTAVNTLQSHMSHLRNVLGSKAAILARPPGYLLDLGSDGTDVRLAERLLRQGTQSADPVDGARHLQSALALWRGRPLADVPGLAWLEEQAEQLDLLWLQVKRALAKARLAAGEHAHLALTRSGFRCRGSPRACQPRPGCTAACWRASGYWWCLTTRETSSRFARCYPARPVAWPL